MKLLTQRYKDRKRDKHNVLDGGNLDTITTTTTVTHLQ